MIARSGVKLGNTLNGAGGAACGGGSGVGSSTDLLDGKRQLQMPVGRANQLPAARLAGMNTSHIPASLLPT